jgi:hypothetical protein
MKVAPLTLVTAASLSLRVLTRWHGRLRISDGLAGILLGGLGSTIRVLAWAILAHRLCILYELIITSSHHLKSHAFARHNCCEQATTLVALYVVL